MSFYPDDADEEVCTNCGYSNCICDLPDDLAREAELDTRD